MVIKSINYNYNEDAGETAGTLDRSENSMEYEYKLSTKQGSGRPLDTLKEETRNGRV